MYIIQERINLHTHLNDLQKYIVILVHHSSFRKEKPTIHFGYLWRMFFSRQNLIQFSKMLDKENIFVLKKLRG